MATQKVTFTGMELGLSGQLPISVFKTLFGPQGIEIEDRDPMGIAGPEDIVTLGKPSQLKYLESAISSLQSEMWPQGRPHSGDVGSVPTAGGNQATPSSTNRYIHKVGDAVDKNLMQARTAEWHGAFILPYLYPGAKLLDCGCGPATITVGYVKYVGSEGDVVGIDREPGQIEAARRTASDRGVTNVRFEIGDIYQLPFADNSFDVVVSTTTFEHLHRPVEAFKELLRVVKPGCPVGVRANDWQGGLNLEPANETLNEAVAVYLDFRRHNGGHPDIGKRLRAIALEAGGIESKWTATSDYWASPETVVAMKEVLLNELAGSSIRETAISLGWADEAHFKATEQAVEDWGNSASAVFAILQGEIVAWKPI